MNTRILYSSKNDPMDILVKFICIGNEDFFFIVKQLTLFSAVSNRLNVCGVSRMHVPL